MLARRMVSPRGRNHRKRITLPETHTTSGTVRRSASRKRITLPETRWASMPPQSRNRRKRITLPETLQGQNKKDSPHRPSPFRRASLYPSCRVADCQNPQVLKLGRGSFQTPREVRYSSCQRTSPSGPSLYPSSPPSQLPPQDQSPLPGPAARLDLCKAGSWR